MTFIVLTNVSRAAVHNVVNLYTLVCGFKEADPYIEIFSFYLCNAYLRMVAPSS